MKISNLIIAFVIILTGILPVFVSHDHVQAAGSTTVTLSIAANKWGVVQHTHNTGMDNLDYLTAWIYSIDHCSSFITSGSPQVGWWGDLQTQYNPDVHRIFPRDAMFGFDLSAIPADAEYISANISIRVSGKEDTSTVYSDFYWSIYKTQAGADAVLDINDFNKYQALNYRLSPPQHYNTLVNDQVTVIPITADLDLALARGPGNNWVFFQALTENQARRYAPTWESSKGIKFDISAGIGEYPKLTITYTAPAVRGDEDLHTNAAVNTTPLGNEVANNITLETLRCMYADETLSFLVNGESGANVTLELRDQDNALITSHSDSVRVDGVYSWQLAMTSTYNGFVRVHETNFDLYSDWVSVRSPPSATEETNRIYAGSTVFPQYTTPFSSYVVYDDDLMFIHYKTNINPATELGDFNFALYSNGVTSVYDDSLADIAVNYFGGTTANQQALSHWRYMIFTPAIVSSDLFGGLVNNLEFDANRATRTGFIEARIYAPGGALLAGSHSAYWYLSAVSQGIAISIPAELKSTDKLVATLQIGDECKAQTYLNQGAILLSNANIGNFIASLGTQYITTIEIDSGTFTVSMTLNMVENTTYQYRFDMPLVVSLTGGDGNVDDISDPNSIFGLLGKILGFFDTSTESSHWILLIVGMGLLCALFWFSSLLRVVMPMLLFGAACVSNWIDPWWVILLALGAGVYLFSMFKKKTGSGGEE